MKGSAPIRRPDFQATALEAAETIAGIADLFPKDEAARVICNIAVGRLNQLYGVSKEQRRARVLAKIGEGYQSIFELTVATWYERREIESLLKDLIDAGEIVERKEKPTGGLGRPCRKFRLK